MQNHLRLDSFELSLSDIASIDVNMLHALSLGVSWPHRPEDWNMLRHVGKGFAATDGIGRVFGTAMWFSHGTDFATVGMVITSPRLQARGNGRWLMDRVLDRCGDRNLILNATREAYQLYVSLGFVPEATVYQCQGEAATQLPSLRPMDGELRAIPKADFDSLAALDTRAFGADRTRLLKVLAPDSSGYGIWRDGALIAYAFRRRFGRGQVIGPIVASNDDDAMQLVSAHLADVPRQFARVDTRHKEGAFMAFLQESGLRVFDTVTTMSRGRPLLKAKMGEPSIYGLAAHALS
ncbi:GNAT family N-acetyltransferase [Microvirga sp. VF16]|uniref:GNAT family N-acetyltransferase n=1 Tax=Microvirga sp. VF16 TaxID=2807101 RepID=UPI00193DE139|nr:GNAT family N-acetyltransferase [Microvirga sp. VF16]QRM34469.1 GNAT family N-acetyltransferase [Microvirga sp. VF16]